MKTIAAALTTRSQLLDPGIASLSCLIACHIALLTLHVTFIFQQCPLSSAVVVWL